MPFRRETVDAKAARLVQASKVTWVDQSTALVDGDSDRYMVRFVAGAWTCMCPWGRNAGHQKACSHVLAAALTSLRGPKVPAPAQPARSGC